jgi:quercetin dioxygenase-like cupin family protein
LVRSNEGRSVDHDEDLPPGAVRSVVAGDRGLTAMEFRGVPLQFGQFYDHPGEELYLVVRGRVEVDLDGEMIELGPGDTLCYDGRIPHRSRVGPGAAADDVLVYLITTRDDVRED